MLTTSEVARLLDIANAGVNKGHITEARTIYEGILEGRPDHVPTRISLALSHIAVGEFAKADEILGQVLAVNAEDPDALVYLGLSAKFQGRLDEAAEIFGRIPAGTHAAELAAQLMEV